MTLHAELCREFGVETTADTERPGVRVNGRRVVHVGVAVRNWVSSFGLIVNVNPDLAPFRDVRCDGDPFPMTSLARESEHRVRVTTVRQRLVELIVERFDVSYLPSAAVLLRDSSGPSHFWAPPWRRQLVSFAAPRILPASRGAAMELGGAELSNPLPASADEARAIARTCPGRAQLFLGSANLKRHLLEGAAAGVPLLHLATHAVADMTSAERSRILFSPDREQDGADYLFLKEVYDLDLRGVDLATLSACETERGKLVRGEGPYGFSRALLSAGARAAVTTLWRVADEPARDFMAQLYFELNRGKPKAEALRLAKLRFLGSGTALRHPRYWAAFILTGDGLSPIPRVLSWSMLLGAVGVLLLGGVAAMLVRNAAASRSAGRSPPGGGTRP